MGQEYLAAPKPPIDLKIPHSDQTVKVKIIDK